MISGSVGIETTVLTNNYRHISVTKLSKLVSLLEQVILSFSHHLSSVLGFVGHDVMF